MPRPISGVSSLYDRTVTGEHGRIETREYWVIRDPEVLTYLNSEGRWHGLSAIGMVQTERSSNGTSAHERRYYILSGTLSAAAFAHAVRGHWGIENCVHWVLDVTFDEDRSRVRTGNAPQNFAVLRHIALNLLRHEPSKASINTKRFRAALNEHYLLKVLQA
jgi:predicted transposase YbfD/YdcC